MNAIRSFDGRCLGGYCDGCSAGGPVLTCILSLLSRVGEGQWSGQRAKEEEHVKLLRSLGGSIRKWHSTALFRILTE